MRLASPRPTSSSCPQRQRISPILNAPDSEVIAGYVKNLYYSPEKRDGILARYEELHIC